MSLERRLTLIVQRAPQGEELVVALLVDRRVVVEIFPTFYELFLVLRVHSDEHGVIPLVNSIDPSFEVAGVAGLLEGLLDSLHVDPTSGAAGLGPGFIIEVILLPAAASTCGRDRESADCGCRAGAGDVGRRLKDLTDLQTSWIMSLQLIRHESSLLLPYWLRADDAYWSRLFTEMLYRA